MQGLRYTTFAQLRAAKKLSQLFGTPEIPREFDAEMTLSTALRSCHAGVLAEGAIVVPRVAKRL